jgi:hypothetical protein
MDNLGNILFGAFLLLVVAMLIKNKMDNKKNSHN